MLFLKTKYAIKRAVSLLFFLFTLLFSGNSIGQDFPTLCNQIERSLHTDLQLFAQTIDSCTAHFYSFTNKEQKQLLPYFIEFSRITKKPLILEDLSIELQQSNIEDALIIASSHLSQNEILSDTLLTMLKDAANEKGYQQTRSNALLLLGQHERLKKRNNKALYYFGEAKEVSSRSDDKRFFSISFYHSALIHFEKHAFEKAYTFLLRALKEEREHGLKYREIIYLNELGRVQLSLQNYNLALSYFEDAVDLANELNSEVLKAEPLSNIGLTLLENEQEKKQAIPFFQQALITYYQFNHIKGIAETHKRIGIAYQRVGENGLARENFNLGFSYAKEINEPYQTASLHYHLAELFYSQDKIDETIDHAILAKQIQEENNLMSGLSKSFLLLSECYSIKKDFKNAYNCLHRSSTINEKLKAHESKSKIAELNKLFQAEQRERIIVEQQRTLEEKANQEKIREQELKNKELQKRQLFYLLISIALGFTAVLTFIILKNRQKQLKQKQRSMELQQQVFRSQMNPHFIFNSMSVIQSFIYEKDVKNAAYILVNFSRLVRLILENSSKSYIPLKTEIEIIKRYLAVQKTRFENRFDYSLEIEPPLEVDQIAVPPMLIQPFIENAIEHGQLHIKEDGFIKISISIKEDLIYFIVEDNGIGIDPSQASKKGKEHKSMATEITRQRVDLISQQYKSSGSFEIMDLSQEGQSGTRVSISCAFKKLH